MKNSKKIIEDNGIYCIKDEKFNEVIMSLRILLPLSKDTSTMANLLAHIFTDRLEKAPSKSAMLKKTDDLYGAKIDARTYTVGKYHVIDLSVLGINASFVDEDLHQAYYDLLIEMLKEPLINANTLKEAKNTLRQRLLRIDESPAHYAIFKSFELAAQDQLFGVNAYGYLDDFEAITVEKMKAFHQDCVTKYPKELYAVGNIASLDFVDETTFKKIKESAVHKTKITQDTMIETYKGNQSEMVLIYESDIHPNHKLYYPYLVMLGVLGQGANSLLFQNIREKHSYCYSIYASQLIFDGLFYIGTSVNQENEDKVLTLIEEQFELIRQKEFDLDASKNTLINNISGTSENSRQLLEFYSRNNRLDLNDTIDDLIENFKQVTKDEVVLSLDYIKEHFTFIYRGEDNEIS